MANEEVMKATYNWCFHCEECNEDFDQDFTFDCDPEAAGTWGDYILQAMCPICWAWTEKYELNTDGSVKGPFLRPDRGRAD